MQRGRTARDVGGLVEPPRVIKPELVPLTLPEARAVLVAAESAENSARWSDALALGLRQGEALGLLWRDVDLDRGTPMVRRALQRQKGQGLVLVEPKSRAGRRTIALPDTLLAALRNHRVAQLQHPVTAAGVYEDRGVVFAQHNGHPYGGRQDWEAWQRLLAAAGVRDVRLHDARHTAATLLLAQGVDVRVVMQLLGHSQISMTTHCTRCRSSPAKPQRAWTRRCGVRDDAAQRQGRPRRHHPPLRDHAPRPALAGQGSSRLSESN